MSAPTPPALLFRVEIDRDGKRLIWAIVAQDLVEAARRARAIADRPTDRVLALQAVAELL